VAVFAHNEEKNIIACLDSLPDAARDCRIEAHVLVNGCTDRTLELVSEYAKEHAWIVVHAVEMGDKANAWNVYVHELAPEADTHFFIDGDVEACPNALLNLQAALDRETQALAAAAVPATGRGRAASIRSMLSTRELAGNLYALRGSFLQRLKAARIRMPQGLIGEDSLVGALVKTDLDPGTWDNRRVATDGQACFRFRSLTPFSLADWRLYGRRKIRYSLRRFQFLLLRDHFRSVGFRAMPSRIESLYAVTDSPRLRLTWRGLNSLFDWLALRRVRMAAARAAAEDPVIDRMTVDDARQNAEKTESNQLTER
jgi:glycosyltransferase involved in cell wall biosynthesis